MRADRMLLAVIALSLTACQVEGQEAGSPKPPSPTASPTPENNTADICKRAGELLGRFGTTATRAGGGVITQAEAAEAIKKDQRDMDLLADEATDNVIRRAVHEMADAFGRVRVFLVDGTDVDEDTIKVPSNALLAACRSRI